MNKAPASLSESDQRAINEGSNGPNIVVATPTEMKRPCSRKRAEFKRQDSAAARGFPLRHEVGRAKDGLVGHRTARQWHRTPTAQLGSVYSRRIDGWLTKILDVDGGGRAHGRVCRPRS